LPALALHALAALSNTCFFPTHKKDRVMSDKQRTLFFAAYFSELETIKNFANSPIDLDLIVPIDQNYRQWNEQTEIKISVLEILRMVYDLFIDLKDRTSLYSEIKINPKRIFQKAQQSIDCLNEKFGLQESIPDIDYGKYVKLIYDLQENTWIDSDEYNEFQNKGYRKIDLDLINEGMKRNVKDIIKLLQQGANPYIDPYDGNTESALIDSLQSAKSFYFNNFCELYQSYLDNSSDDLRQQDCYRYLWQLYGVASSAEMIRTIKNYTRPEFLDSRQSRI
jgi:hypothetical protein